MADSPVTPDAPQPGTPPADLLQARDRAQSLLPWAANGSLDPQSAAWLEGWLRSTELTHPALVAPLQAELVWLRHTASDMQRNVREQLPEPEQGLDTLLHRIASERAAGLPSRTRLPRKVAWLWGSEPWGRASAWLNNHGPQLAGACAALAVALATTLALLPRGSSELYPLGGDTGVPEVRGTQLLLVAFRPDATESAIRQALRDSRTQLVGGPSALGLYVLRVKTEDTDTALALLRDRQAVVESVQRVK